jgi:hypothetical protein
MITVLTVEDEVAIRNNIVRRLKLEGFSTISATGWLVGWLAGWLAGWLVGWLAGWLVGWSVRALSSPTSSSQTSACQP